MRRTAAEQTSAILEQYCAVSWTGQDRCWVLNSDAKPFLRHYAY